MDTTCPSVRQSERKEDSWRATRRALPRTPLIVDPMRQPPNGFSSSTSASRRANGNDMDSASPSPLDPSRAWRIIELAGRRRWTCPPSEGIRAGCCATLGGNKRVSPDGAFIVLFARRGRGSGGDFALASPPQLRSPREAR